MPKALKYRIKIKGEDDAEDSEICLATHSEVKQWILDNIGADIPLSRMSSVFTTGQISKNYLKDKDDSEVDPNKYQFSRISRKDRLLALIAEEDEHQKKIVKRRIRRRKLKAELDEEIPLAKIKVSLKSPKAQSLKSPSFQDSQGSQDSETQ